MPQRKRASSTKQYIRNIRYMPVSIRLSKDRRIELQPRGNRGDCAPVSEEDMDSTAFSLNKDLLFEVITEDEAKSNVEKQTTNQQAVHPALSQLRSPQGETYKKGVVVQENIEVEGTTVGNINERGMITRYDTLGTVDRPFQGDGTLQTDEVLAQTDEIARDKSLEGPQAGIGNLKVTKGNTEKQ